MSHSDALAEDFLLSTFVAAAQHYRRDTVLRPFPPNFISKKENVEEKDHTQLLRCIQRLPRVSHFHLCAGRE